MITQSRSSVDENLIYTIGFDEINLGDNCEKGTQLRPNIVWFGEEVPNMDKACELVSCADIFVIIGTSLNVHPAAGLIHHAPTNIKKYLIDPNEIKVNDIENLTFIREKATVGTPILINQHLKVLLQKDNAF